MTVSKLRPINPRKQPRVCDCGQHAWTILTRGWVTLVSPGDAHFLEERLWSAYETERQVYAHSAVGLLHRQILKAEPSVLTDHENWNGLDNRRENIRACNKSQNAANSRQNRNRHGFVGVNKAHQKYRAQFRKKYIGIFSSAEEAARAYDREAVKYYGEFARLNFP